MSNLVQVFVNGETALIDESLLYDPFPEPDDETPETETEPEEDVSSGDTGDSEEDD